MERPQRILVTGGAGFIGSHTVEALIEARYDVAVLDDLSTGTTENLPQGVDLIEGSILDDDDVQSAVANSHVIVHLAAYTSVSESFDAFELCYRINVGGTSRVVEAAISAGVGRIVFASSSAVYAEVGTDLKVETECPMPGSPYAVSKLEGEHLLQRALEREGITFAAMRYFNVYGHRQRTDSAYAAAVPLFLERGISGEPMTVYGDGKQTRDFVHVEDVAKANLRAVESKLSGVYNVGTGVATQIDDLATRVARICESRAPLQHRPERPGDARSSEADITRIRSELDWSPHIPLDKGLRKTLSYHLAKTESRVA